MKSLKKSKYFFFTNSFSVHESMWLLHSFGQDDLCKQMINDLI